MSRARIPPPWTVSKSAASKNIAKRQRLARKFPPVSMTKDELRNMAAQAIAASAAKPTQ